MAGSTPTLDSRFRGNDEERDGLPLARKLTRKINSAYQEEQYVSVAEVVTRIRCD